MFFGKGAPPRGATFPKNRPASHAGLFFLPLENIFFEVFFNERRSCTGSCAAGCRGERAGRVPRGGRAAGKAPRRTAPREGVLYRLAHRQDRAAFGAGVCGHLFGVPRIPRRQLFEAGTLPTCSSSWAGSCTGRWRRFAISGVKELLSLIDTQTIGVGEVANFLLTLSFVLVPTIVYRFKKGLPTVTVTLAIGCVLQIAASLVVNRYITSPCTKTSSVQRGGGVRAVVVVHHPLQPHQVRGGQPRHSAAV